MEINIEVEIDAKADKIQHFLSQSGKLVYGLRLLLKSIETEIIENNGTVKVRLLEGEFFSIQCYCGNPETLKKMTMLVDQARDSIL